MTTTPIAIPRNSVSATLCDRVSDAEDGACAAGAFAFCDGHDGTKDVSILFGCPCGCGDLRHVAIKPYARPDPVWSWDGNRESPTLTPSILIHQMNALGAIVGEHWHGFLTAGQWRSC